MQPRRGFPRAQGLAAQGTPAPRLQGLRGLLFLTGCLSDSGHLYRADQSSPAPGLRCLNWLDAHRRLASAPEAGECPPRAGGGRAAASVPAPGPQPPAPSPGPWRLLSPLRRRQPQLLPQPGPGPARALVLRQRRDGRPREAALRGPALPRYPLGTPVPGAVEGRPLPPAPRPLIGQDCLQAAGRKAHWLPPPRVSSASGSGL